MAKAKAKAKPKKQPAAKAKPKPKKKLAAKPKPKAKPKAKAKAKPARRAAPTASSKRRAQIADAVANNPAPARVAAPPVLDVGAAPPSIAPFTIDETRTGFALVLVELGPHAADGYAWEAVARRVAAAARLRNLTYDPDQGMFCAYAPDQLTLGTLGRGLAELYRAPDALVAALAAATTNE
jgi:outer membrane biosynthesis protein TonB|nr:Imm51 family immunity protein [Kofleriaceae bacterium]